MTKPKYFLDTEFIEDGVTIDLISIGIVSEDGRSLYRQNSECSFEKATDWVWRNVFPHLAHFDMRGKRSCSVKHETYDSGLGHKYHTACGSRVDDPCPWATRKEIKDAVLEFCPVDDYNKPEFWGYFADYDWVVFCQLFGPMIALPKGYPMHCNDLKQLAKQAELPKPEGEVHHALADAEWIKESFLYLHSKP